MGPHVTTPRSGEIHLRHIIFWHDIIKLTQQWYFVQCSPWTRAPRNCRCRTS